jgi:hypothetical protein
MAATIENDASLDDNDNFEEGDNNTGKSYVLPNIMPAARDIMPRFPCTPGVAGAVTELASSARSLAPSLQHEGCGPSSMRKNSSLPAGTQSICFWNYTF